MVKRRKKDADPELHGRLIQNYGLFWRWDFVHKGTGGKGGKGALLGQTSARAAQVDFADQRGIYSLYFGHTFVYAGQIDKRGLLKRLIEHCDDDLAERWDRFSFFGTRRVLGSDRLGMIKASATAKTSIVLNQLETFLIHVSAPSLNINRGKWSGAKRYYQCRDDRLPPTMEEQIAALHELAQQSKAGSAMPKRPRRRSLPRRHRKA